MNFIALQNSYDDVQIGLFKVDSLSNNYPQLINQQSINKTDASKLLIPLIDQFLKDHHIKFSEIPFIAVNHGPGPFTTLRTVIATANGISFASGTPLIGVDALQAAHKKWGSQSSSTTAILFNGFTHDVYFLISDNGATLSRGCKNIDLLLQELEQLNTPITFIGNGTTLYHEKISAILGDHAIIPDNYPSYSSIKEIGTLGYASWLSNKKGTNQLMPLYLKNHPVQDKK